MNQVNIPQWIAAVKVHGSPASCAAVSLQVCTPAIWCCASYFTVASTVTLNVVASSELKKSMDVYAQYMQTSNSATVIHASDLHALQSQGASHQESLIVSHARSQQIPFVHKETSVVLLGCRRPAIHSHDETHVLMPAGS